MTEVVNGGFPDGKDYLLLLVEKETGRAELRWDLGFETPEAATGHAAGLIEAGEIAHAYVMTPLNLVWNNPLLKTHVDSK